MKRSLKNLKGYAIEAVDGHKGKVKDFLFDEEKWVIRYLEADYGKLFKSRKVLIPESFLQNPDWEKEIFPIDLTKKQIEDCPKLDEKMPVSREYEKTLSQYYDIDLYWPASYPVTPGPTMYYPPRPLMPPSRVVDEKALETSLRSFREVKGYQIRTTDGKLGQIDDMIIDDEDWQVVYVVIDTSEWKPWSKKVMISIEWLEEISYIDREVTMGLEGEAIKDAPEFDADSPVEIEFERAMYDFYEQTFIKS